MEAFLRQSQSSAERVVDGMNRCIAGNFRFIPTPTNSQQLSLPLRLDCFLRNDFSSMQLVLDHIHHLSLY